MELVMHKFRNDTVERMRKVNGVMSSVISSIRGKVKDKSCFAVKLINVPSPSYWDMITICDMVSFLGTDKLIMPSSWDCDIEHNGKIVSLKECIEKRWNNRFELEFEKQKKGGGAFV